MIGVFLRTDNCLRGSYEHLSAKWLLCGQGQIQDFDKGGGGGGGVEGWWWWSG